MSSLPTRHNASESGRVLLLADPHAAVGSVFLRLANGTFDKPDVRARVELLLGQVVAARELIKQQDSFTPQWLPPSASFSHVPVDDRLQVRISLTDADLVNDDPIGVVVLPRESIEQALRAGKVCYIDVREQTDGQVLFVHLAVRPE